MRYLSYKCSFILTEQSDPYHIIHRAFCRWSNASYRCSNSLVFIIHPVYDVMLVSCIVLQRHPGKDMVSTCRLAGHPPSHFTSQSSYDR